MESPIHHLKKVWFSLYRRKVLFHHRLINLLVVLSVVVAKGLCQRQHFWCFTPLPCLHCPPSFCLLAWDLHNNLTTEISASGFPAYYFLSTLPWVGSLYRGKTMTFMLISKKWGCRKQPSFQAFHIPRALRERQGLMTQMGVFSLPYLLVSI